MNARGLGDADDPFARRERAAEAFLPPPPPPDEDDDEAGDQGKHDRSNTASNSAKANRGQSAEGDGADGGLPPPPPAREPIARVQFNQRIRSDRRKVLDRYRRKHGSTWQAVFDQMVDEYLIRRDLLLKGDEIE